MKSLNILGFDVSTENSSSIIDCVWNDINISVVNTINPHSYVVSKTDRIFCRALKDSDILIPDGSGIVFASKAIHNKTIRKVAGYDLFLSAMKKLEHEKGRVFFLGSTNLVLAKIQQRISQEFPSVIVSTFSPPYKNEFNDQDVADFVKMIRNDSPDIVFVGLTAPKQETLIAKINKQIDVKMISGIGAVFDFYAGVVQRPSSFWINLHLEWLIRFLGEPKRLWRRNFISTPIFFHDVMKYRFAKNKISPP